MDSTNEIGGYIFERVVPHDRNSIYAEVKFVVKDIDINAIDLTGHFLDFLRGAGYSEHTIVRALSEHLKELGDMPVDYSNDAPEESLPKRHFLD